jgi:hypothetical protein
VTFYRCGNEAFGCGARVEWNGYNNAANACHACCGKAARKWHIKAADLPYLSTAIMCARAGKLGEDATFEEVWALLTTLKVERQFWTPPAPTIPLNESQLPPGDRQETLI